MLCSAKERERRCVCIQGEAGGSFLHLYVVFFFFFWPFLLIVHYFWFDPTIFFLFLLESLLFLVFFLAGPLKILMVGVLV